MRPALTMLAGEADPSVHELAEMLNHSNTATAHRYVHPKADAPLVKMRELVFG